MTMRKLTDSRVNGWEPLSELMSQTALIKHTDQLSIVYPTDSFQILLGQSQYIRACLRRALIVKKDYLFCDYWLSTRGSFNMCHGTVNCFHICIPSSTGARNSSVLSSWGRCVAQPLLSVDDIIVRGEVSTTVSLYMANGLLSQVQWRDVSLPCDVLVIQKTFFQCILQLLFFSFVSKNVPHHIFSNPCIGIHWGQRNATRFPAGYSAHQVLPVLPPPGLQKENGSMQQSTGQP